MELMILLEDLISYKKGVQYVLQIQINNALRFLLIIPTLKINKLLDFIEIQLMDLEKYILIAVLLSYLMVIIMMMLKDIFKI